MARQDLIPLRRGTKAAWTAANPTLAEGEPGFETDTYTLKVGDGSTPYTTLPALNMGIQYYNAQVNGFNVSKDNNDIERKFWKDDFSLVEHGYTLVGSVTGFGTGVVSLSANLASFKKSVVVPDGHILRVRIKFAAIPTTNKFTNIHLGSTFKLRFHNTVYFDDGGALHSGVLHGISSTTEYTTIDTWIQNGLGYVNVNGTPVLVGKNVGSRHITDTGVSLNDSTGDLREICEIACIPPESYADDFTSDTVTGANGRYQAVTGTVAYDGTNKRMNVTTATGANGKASGRLKSYKFTEGSQIYDVTLPTGADGDFICMVTHATNGAMTNGIGVGLQSDGAGNWNLATLSGTTVTEGADSGLDDADVARIEIEKDISGAYWYYIYNVAGTKPTTPTGKLFTTLTEGYTGWYANGAGATTQTFSIDNISIRAESIVGRTNVPVEEAFWFRDEFGDDSTGRMTARAGLTTAISDGKLNLTSTYTGNSLFFGKSIVKDITSYSCKIKEVNDTSSAGGLVFYWDGVFVSGVPNKAYTVSLDYSLGKIRFLKRVGGAATYLDGTGFDVTVTAGIYYTVSVIDNGDGTFTISLDGTPVGTTTADTTYTSGYFGLYCFDSTAAEVNFDFDDLQISGTRVYNRPIHRGAMLESYYDGSEEVAATTFVDDCNWDRSGEWNDSYLTHDTVNGQIYVNTSIKCASIKMPFGLGFYKVDFTTSSQMGDYQYRYIDIGILSSIESPASADAIKNNALSIRFNITPNIIEIYNNGVYLNSLSCRLNASTNYTIMVLASGSSANIYIYSNGVYLISKNITATINTSGYTVIAHTSAGTGTTHMLPARFTNITCITTPTSFENGIAASISGVGGGARYDTVETIGTTFDNEVQSGRYHAYARYLGTVSGCILETVEARVENTTDSSSIIIGESARTFPLTFDTTMSEYLDEDVWLNYDDIGDEITFNLERASELEHVHPTIFVDSIALIPVSEVR